MNKSRSFSMLAAVIATSYVAQAARSSLVTWEFAGHLTEVNDAAGVLPGSITVGTPFFGSYTFESDTADTLPGDPSEGVYPAVTDVQVELYAIVFTGPIGPRSIGVGLGSAVFPAQSYGTNIGVELDGRPADTFLTLRAENQVVFTSDALPREPPPLELFDSATFVLRTRDKSVEFHGEVSSLVPEPSTGLLIILGTLILLNPLIRQKRATQPGRRHVARLTLILLAHQFSPVAIAVDCNANETNDECDLNCDWPRCGVEPCGGVTDCNGSRIPDECELPECQEIEVVFVMDVSGSIEGPTPNQLCVEIAEALDALNDPPFGPLTVHAEIVAIGTPDPDRGDELCDCCCEAMSGCSLQEETVPGKYGLNTCGLPETVGDCFNLEGPVEDWGTATAVVAANKKWGPGPRIVVPISDEGPRCGDPLEDPGADRDVVDRALPIVWCSRAIVSALVDVEIDALRRLAEAFVDGAVAGGELLDISDPSCLSVRLAKMIASSCPSDCNANGVPDSCDIAGGTSRDCFHHCCTAHGSSGCDDPVVECEVSAQMPDCCTVEWTTACADLAESLGRCGSGDGIPDDCQTDGPDCDSEGTPDTCTINCGPANAPCSGFTGCGQSTDCDNDCIPDDCQALADCQPNGVPDDCDIASGGRRDCFSGESNCCGAHGGSGCDDDFTEQFVCLVEPDCCNVAWTQDCADLALQFAGSSCDGINGVPDECESVATRDCNNNTIPDDCDLDCDARASCPVGCGASTDCDENCMPDECDLLNPFDPAPDCQPDDIHDACQLDCDSNGIPDECDLAAGGMDCDGSGVLDECEIEDGILCDGDENGISDDCAACCVAGSCETLTEAACTAQSGEFFSGVYCVGDVDASSNLTCACDIEACCEATACNEDVVDCQCRLDGGQNRLSCNDCPTGACCVPDGTCFDGVALGACTSGDFVRGGECATGACLSCGDKPIDPPTREPCGTCKSRFISFSPGNACRSTAIRVTLTSLHESPCPDRHVCRENGKCIATEAPCDSHDDCPAPPEEVLDPGDTVRWVGPPVAYAEDSVPAAAGIVAAPLQCAPHYRDWSEQGLAAAADLPDEVCPVSPPACEGCVETGGCVGVDTSLIHVFGGEIMPCSTYEVQVIDEECDETDESAYSEALEVTTGKWGDAARPFYHAGSADGQEPSFIDIGKVTNKFKSLPPPDTPIKADAWMKINVPEPWRKIDFIDIGLVVDAFKSLPYKYYGPCPCATEVVCGTLDCDHCASDGVPCDEDGDWDMLDCVTCGDGEICSFDAYGMGELRCRDECKRCVQGS